MMALNVSAQKLTIDGGLRATNEITASQYPRKDANNQPCALLKVEVVDAITEVEGGVVGNIVNKGTEKWGYFERGQKVFKIHFVNHLSVTVNTNDYGINGLQANNTYVLRLVDNSITSTPVTNQPQNEISSANDNVLTFTVNGVSFNMIKVAGGTFTMGANVGDSEAESDETRHQVTLSDYYIGETEVTQALWKAVMGSNPSNFKGDNLPVEMVSWNDCQEFISKLNAKTGATFSLPTEAEWEYAARGGSKSRGYKYSGSNSIDAVAWYTDNSGSKTHAVKTKQANELGIYDMSGNVWEWCSDWYGSYGSSSQTNPTGALSGSSRVNRGDSWFNSARTCRVSFRNFSTPDDSNSNLGLRLALRK